MTITFESDYATHVITVSVERRGHSRCHTVTESSRNRAARLARDGFGVPEHTESTSGARVVYQKEAR